MKTKNTITKLAQSRAQTWSKVPSQGSMVDPNWTSHAEQVDFAQQAFEKYFTVRISMKEGNVIAQLYTQTGKLVDTIVEDFTFMSDDDMDKYFKYPKYFFKVKVQDDYMVFYPRYSRFKYVFNTKAFGVKRFVGGNNHVIF